MSTLAVASSLLILVGLYGVVLKRNLLKIVIGVELLALGVAGLVVDAGVIAAGVAHVSQGVALIAVVGGSAVVALMTVTAVRLYEKHKVIDVREMRRLKG
ncbi:MAG: NADH-quinone oxidoreductase subunit K [Dehalococcoidia bacterium]|nr:NADH-quinone oxidoreductase subunit K [Dehalococcoidia bacterium]